MSQFAAQAQAETAAASRAQDRERLAEEARPSVHRGTPQGFRLLQQRLKAKPQAHAPDRRQAAPPAAKTLAPMQAPAEEEVAARHVLDVDVPAPPVTRAEVQPFADDPSLDPPEPPPPESRSRGALAEAFDVDGLFSAVLEVDFSAAEAWADAPLLQESQAPEVPAGAWTEEEEAAAPRHAPDPSRLKHLRLPEKPPVDEFSLADFASEPVELRQPERAPEDSEPASHATQGFWETGGETSAEPQAEPLPPQPAELEEAAPQEMEAAAPRENEPLDEAPPALSLIAGTTSSELAEVFSPAEESPPPPQVLGQDPGPAAEPSFTPAADASAEPKVHSESRRHAVLMRRANEVESEEAGELAASLLEIMSLPANATQPQERALAADTLLHLVHRLPHKTLVALVERLSMMETPPPLILAELIHDARIEVAGPLLEKCAAINDHDLLEVIADGNQQSNRMIARRRALTSVLCDALIATDDPSVVLTLVRNPGATISHEAFYKLNEMARAHPALQAPLATRSDLPAPVAFELFWVLPVELRRYVISRFLTDSTTLNRILKLTLRMDSDQPEEATHRFARPEEIERLIDSLGGTNGVAAEALMSSLLGIAPQTARRILADAQGEPLTVALKAAGASRAQFEQLLSQLLSSTNNFVRPRSSAAELQSFFECLSFNKARVLLTYWDWAVSRTGPYAALGV
jgi:hypothetical protein